MLLWIYEYWNLHQDPHLNFLYLLNEFRSSRCFVTYTNCPGALQLVHSIHLSWILFASENETFETIAMTQILKNTERMRMYNSSYWNYRDIELVLTFLFNRHFVMKMNSPWNKHITTMHFKRSIESNEHVYIDLRSNITCNEFEIAKTYWNTAESSLTDRKPNNQLTPRRGTKVQMDFIPDLKGYLKKYTLNIVTSYSGEGTIRTRSGDFTVMKQTYCPRNGYMLCERIKLVQYMKWCLITRVLYYF